jgi:hypothetical protein
MRGQPVPAGCPRPALFILIRALEALSRRQRNEIARMGRKAKAAKTPRIRRLTRKVTAEARRLGATPVTSAAGWSSTASARLAGIGGVMSFLIGTFGAGAEDRNAPETSRFALVGMPSRRGCQMPRCRIVHRSA